MKTSQPIWKLVANLGDTSPIEYGGYFVFEDTTRVYAPEAELWVTDDTDENTCIEVRRIVLEPCTFINGILSANKFHPETPAWFANEVGSVANYSDIPVAEFIDSLVNGNSISKAIAWRAIGDYFGWDNLDAYPLQISTSEARKRIDSNFYRDAQPAS